LSLAQPQAVRGTGHASPQAPQDPRKQLSAAQFQLVRAAAELSPWLVVVLQISSLSRASQASTRVCAHSQTTRQLARPSVLRRWVAVLFVSVRLAGLSVWSRTQLTAHMAATQLVGKFSPVRAASSALTLLSGYNQVIGSGSAPMVVVRRAGMAVASCFVCRPIF